MGTNHLSAGLRAALVLAAAAAGAACSAISDHKVLLSYPPSEAKVDASPAGRPAITVVPFVDGTTTGDVLGEAYAKGETPIETWRAGGNVGEFLRDALVAELREAGLAAGSGDQGGSEAGLRVEGKVHVFFTWSGSADLFATAGVSFDVSLLDKGRAIFLRSYSSKKTMPKTNPDRGSLLAEATREAMRQAADDVRGFLQKEGNRVP